MEENPYRAPNEVAKTARRRRTGYGVFATMWPFWLLLLLLAIAGVVVPMVATMN